MKAKTRKRVDHSGSTFDSFLDEHGIRAEVEAVAIKRVLAWQIEHEMQRQRKTKQAMAGDLRTSRSQLDRLLDPGNTSVSLETISRAVAGGAQTPAAAAYRLLGYLDSPRKGD